jgi:hypothetical protein
MNAHHMDAIPLELMAGQQDRITKEMAETERQLVAAEVGLDRVENMMRRSMQFLTNCYQTYVMAPPQVRRQLNQAVFEAFYVRRDGSLCARPTEAFWTFLRTDALTPTAGEPEGASGPAELHDSRDWVDSRPKWLVEAETKRGQSCKSSSTPVFWGLGLNSDYLAEGVGFEPTGLVTQRFSRPSQLSALPSLPWHPGDASRGVDV